MLDKYQHFRKVSKTEACSFYEASDRTTMQEILLKRLEQKETWDELLNNPNLQFLSKQNLAPKMIEIFKKKSYYFIAYDKPTGFPLSQPEQIGKMSIQKFYLLFNNLIENCIQLKQHCPEMYILPEWVFLHRNYCKIVHFEPFFPTQYDKKKHVFMFNLNRQGEEQPDIASSQKQGFQRRKNLLFNLGIIGYQLLTGKKAIVAQTQDQYNLQIQKLIDSCKSKIKNITNDQKLSDYLSKMIEQDPYQSPSLNSLKIYFNKKAKEIYPRGGRNLSVELQIEKIHLNILRTPQEKKKKKLFRPCCQTLENEQLEFGSQKKGNATVAYKKQYKTPYKGRRFLPEIQSNRHRYKSKDTLQTRPLMLKSQGYFRYTED